MKNFSVLPYLLHLFCVKWYEFLYTKMNLKLGAEQEVLQPSQNWYTMKYMKTVLFYAVGLVNWACTMLTCNKSQYIVS